MPTIESSSPVIKRNLLSRSIQLAMETSQPTPEAAVLAGVLAAAEAALPGKGLDLLVRGAASRGDLTTMRYLLEHGGKAPSKHDDDVDMIPDVTSEGCESMMPSTTCGRVMGAVPDPAVQMDGDETSFDATSLIIAAANGNAGVVDVLLKTGVNVDTVEICGAPPLLIAAKEGHKDIAKNLLKAGADVDKASDDIGTAPLIAAVQHGNTTVVEQLLESGADVNTERESDGSTPVLIACLKGLEDVTKLLIRAGADLNKARTDDGTTPLLIAAGKGNESLVKSLLRAGADPNKARTTDDGLNALSAAALNGNEVVVELLIMAGARIVTESGESALTLAACEGHIGVCSLLFKAGADVNHKSEVTGHTPLNVAVTHDQRETALFLLGQHGASSAIGNFDRPSRKKLAKWVVQEMMHNVNTMEMRKYQKAKLKCRRATAPHLHQRRQSVYNLR